MTWKLPGYEFVTELGHGSMGTVVLARQLSVDRLVAVKQVHLSTSRSARSRLAREAKALALLENPHVVRFFGLESVADNLYLVLELVDGPPLSTVAESGALAAPDALAILSQLAAGLSYIHARGVVHRDMKPSNVLLSSEGVCKLNDFGLVRLLDAASGKPIPMTVLTRDGMPVGTAAYMSPEAVVGDRNLDHRADLYALAVISYYLLVGCLPFPDSLDLLPMLNAQLNTPPPAPATIDPNFPDVVAVPIMRALQKDRDDRYDTVEAFWRDLDNAAALAWPEWSSRTDLLALVIRHGPLRQDSAAQGSAPTLATILPVESVTPVMPKLKRHRRRLPLVVSAAIGIGVSLGVFELVSRLIR